MTANKSLSEAVGTFGLVFAGCAAIIVNDSFGGALCHVGVSLAFGLVVMAMIYSFGNISGAHINPAVTIGFVVAGRLRPGAALPYIVSQLAGALCASVALSFLFPEHTTLGATVPSGAVAQAFAMEAILSFLLMLVILNMSTGHMEKGVMAGVAIGGTVALEALIGGPVTGASMNPARSFGPAFVSGQLEFLWIYLSAPVVGAVLAGPTCRWIQGRECCSTRSRDGSLNA
jgi:aquaporin Z